MRTTVYERCVQQTFTKHLQGLSWLEIAVSMGWLAYLYIAGGILAAIALQQLM